MFPCFAQLQVLAAQHRARSGGKPLLGGTGCKPCWVVGHNPTARCTTYWVVSERHRDPTQYSLVQSYWPPAAAAVVNLVSRYLGAGGCWAGTTSCRVASTRQPPNCDASALRAQPGMVEVFSQPHAVRNVNLETRGVKGS